MEQLLRISTTNAQLAYNVNHGGLSQRTENPTYSMNRQKGGLSIESTLPKLNIDQKAAFDSVNPSVSASIRQAAQKGHQAADSATQESSDHARMFKNAQVGEDVIGQISRNTLSVDTNVNVDFLPKAPPEFTFEPGQLQMSYEMDKLAFDWRVQQRDVDFVATEIDFHMAQRPSINIEYIGGPVYVPKAYVPGAS